MYRPLPSCLTIKESDTHGLGLFATKDIPAGVSLGMSHLKHHAKWIRTPLGGFYNHSEEPNCFKKREKNVFKDWYELTTLRDIKAGEEILVETRSSSEVRTGFNKTHAPKGQQKSNQQPT